MIVLPPSSQKMKRLNAIGFILDRRRTIQRHIDRNGRCFSTQVPVFGKTVVVADPALATRRCVGAAFANMEMDVVLRTVLRTRTIQTTTKPGEKSHNRGVAYTPKGGGRIVVHCRNQGEQP